jgi:hypothetical protein
VGKPEGKRPLGRPRRRWVDNIKMDLGEIGWDDEPSGSLKLLGIFLNGCTIGSFSERAQLRT